MKWFLILFVFKFFSGYTAHTLPKFTIDEYLNATYYPSLSLSPNGQYLLVRSVNPVWESDRYDNKLWLYETQAGHKKLITNKHTLSVQPKWSPSGNWIAFLVDENPDIKSTENQYRSGYSKKNDSKPDKYLHLYNIL